MLGFDIGGTKCAVCVGVEAKDGLDIIGKKVIPTDHTVSAYEMIDRMCELAEKMTDDFSKIGISCGGPLDSEKGVIMSPPNLPGWDNIEIVDHLKKRYSGEVALQNDANACALAEWKYGAGKGTRNMVFLTFGTGLGAGLILDGKLYSGTNGNAGEVGHIRLADYGPVGYGKSGSFEGFCSGNGIAQIGRIKAIEQYQMGKTVSYCDGFGDLMNVTAKRIAVAAENGDESALSVYRLCGCKLGLGLSVLIDILNPERIVIGSIYTRSKDMLEPYMNEIIAKEALAPAAAVCEIVPAALGEQIGDHAALAVAVAI